MNRTGEKIRCLVPDLPSTSELIPYLSRIEDARWYSNFGPLVEELEARLGAVLGSTVVTCSSGTTALEAGLAAHRLPERTRVLIPSLTFPATAQAVVRAGLVPVLSDVDSTRWQLTPKMAMAAAERSDIGMVLPVATYGLPVDEVAWDEFTAQTGIPVMIDAAAAFNVQRVGRTTSIALSFHATKPFGIGEGGAFVTNDDRQEAYARTFTNFGFVDGEVRTSGGNGKLSEYHAAVGLAQLVRWPLVVGRRTRVWQSYRRELEQRPMIRHQPHAGAPGPSVLTVLVPADAGEVSRRLAEEDVETRRWYVPPLHMHPSFARAYEQRAFPNADSIARHGLGLPFHGHLHTVELIRVVETLDRVLEEFGATRRLAS